MILRTQVGQIFLTHSKDENYAAIYQATITKQEQDVELFVVVDLGGPSAREQKREYEKLTASLVTAFKKTFAASPNLDGNTFEKSLANINAALSRMASRGRVSWYSAFGAGIAAIWNGTLWVSTAGNAQVFLLRDKNLSTLSENPGSENINPVKTFSNFTSGSLISGDRLTITTSQLFNYLSLGRLTEFLHEDSVEEACQEVIAALSDIKTAGFATFICDIYNPDEVIEETNSILPALTLPGRPGAKSSRSRAATLAKTVSLLAGKAIWRGIKLFGAFIVTFFRKRPKKYLFVAIGLTVLLLVASITLAAYQRSSQNKLSAQSEALEKLEQQVGEAEAALVYNDEKRVADLIVDAEKLLGQIDENFQRDRRDALKQRMIEIKKKYSRELRVENPVVLTTFPGVPTEILRSPNGFLAWNRDSKQLSFYDFRTGSTKSVLSGKNLSPLTVGAYLGGENGYFFLDRSGRPVKVYPEEDRIAESAATSSQIFTANTAGIKDIEVLGDLPAQRIYLLDTASQQIWRFRVSGQNIGAAEQWLRANPQNLQNAQDIAVDGSIYVQYASGAEKYFNGNKVNFSLATFEPKLEQGGKIFTKADYQYLYVTDPGNERIIIYQKDGKRFLVITSPKFREVADIYVDEKSKVIHVLAGNELLQVNY